MKSGLREGKKEIRFEHIRLIAQLVCIWLLVALWWGSVMLAPMQIHNTQVTHDLLFFALGFIIFQSIASWKKSNLFLLLPTGLAIGISHAAMKSMRGLPKAGADFFAPQISLIQNLFGVHTSALSGTLIFQGKKITCDLMKMGFFLFITFTLTFLALIIITKMAIRKKIILILVSVLIHYFYFLGRFSLIAAFTPKVMGAGLFPFNLFFWRIALLTYLPLIVLWFFLLYECDLKCVTPLIPRRYKPRKITMNEVYPCLLFLAIGICFALSYYFYGFIQHQKIHCIIDEIHSDWESSLIDFNENIFGSLAENSYHSFLDYLRHFYAVTILDNARHLPPPQLDGVKVSYADTITSSLLATLKNSYPGTHPVLILKCITTPFSQEEISALKNFVYEGGSLFLIGDHSDVFFMNKNINELAHHFGIRFEQNSTYFIDGGWIISTTSFYRNHPATHHLDMFIWATGDSLTLSPSAFPLICSHPVCFADEVNYFFDNFFGNKRVDPSEIFGSFVLMAGSHYGKGKIIAFSDSTCFNNYLMFSVGRRALLSGTLSWLSDKGHLNPFLVCALLLLCLVPFVCMHKRGSDTLTFVYITTAALVSGLALGYFLSFVLNHALYPMPHPLLPMPPQVVIDASHNPRYCLSFGNSEWFLSPTSYDNLLFNCGRIDLFPRIHYKGPLTASRSEEKSCLIIASPQKNFCRKEQEDIQLYIKKGGALLLIEGSHNDSTINQIAHLFNIHFHLRPSSHIISSSGVDGCSVLYHYRNTPIISYKQEGKGFIVIVSDDALFMKKNSSLLGKELVTLQCSIIKALVTHDATILKTMNWDFLDKFYANVLAISPD